MGILGIENRSENWKTARSFAPLFEDIDARRDLANRLLEPLGKQLDPGCDVRLELFWYGVRDWLKKNQEGNAQVCPEVFARVYRKLFRDLRDTIGNSKYFRNLKKCNYNASPEYEEKLYDNLRNTEIDIVLETPGYLFIGEAKHESKFGTNGKLVLVHQLIRQYVAARILVDLNEKPVSKIIPFVVGDNTLRNTHRVKFMVRRNWLKEDNILSWCQICSIGRSAA